MTLRTAIEYDLSEFQSKSEKEIKTYCGYLLEQAYLKNSEGTTNTHMYIRDKDIRSIRDEIANMVYNGKNMLSYEMLLQTVTDVLVSDYMERHGQEQPAAPTLNSFKEVMEATVSYYISRENNPILCKQSVIFIVRMIFNDYFLDNNINVFSRKNGTRKYVFEKTKEELIKEMQQDSKIQSSDMSIILNLYTSFFADYWISKNKSMSNNNYNIYTSDFNKLENIKFLLINQIEKLNLNIYQKIHLMSELEKGNISELESYLPMELIGEYKELIGGLSNHNGLENINASLRATIINAPLNNKQKENLMLALENGNISELENWKVIFPNGLLEEYKKSINVSNSGGFHM